MLGLGLNLTSITAALLDFVRSGLKMWLPFEKSEILGKDLTKGYDFTSGWGNNGNVTINDADTFTTSADNKGIYKTYTTVGKAYKLTVVGTTTSSTGMKITDGGAGTAYYQNSSSGSFSDTVNFTVVSPSNDQIFIRNKSAGEITITTLKVEEVTQIAPDKSNNLNSATLYTGKALSFDGTNDYVDLGSQSMPNTSAATFAFWCNPTLTNDTGDRAVIRYGKSNVWFNDNDEIQVYPDIDGSPVQFTGLSNPSGKYQRFVVTISGTTTKLYIDGTLIGSATTPAISTTASASYIGQFDTNKFLPGKLSDVQLYDVAWTQADVTFDYENPQHLVTNNPSIVKTYGSEVVTDGGFDDDSEWNANTGWTVSGGKASVNHHETTAIRQTLSVTKGKIYDLTFEISDYVEGAFQFGFDQFNIAEISDNLPNFNENGVYNYRVVALGSDMNVYMYAVSASEFSIDNLSLKEETSLNVSNIKGYWHLSEGAGGFAYNSAVALGSEIITNGTFTGITQAESTTGSDWITEAGWTISGGTANCNNTSGSEQDLKTTNRLLNLGGKNLKITFTVSNYSGSASMSVTLEGTGGTDFTGINANDTYSKVVTLGPSENSVDLFFKAANGWVGSIGNVSIKEVSVGTINGGTWSPRQATIPQLGLMDWSKPTMGSDVVTLISDPNHKSKDVLDNIARLREHSLNLDGSGYAKVDSDSSLDIANYSIDGWFYNTNNTSSWETILTKHTQNNFQLVIQNSSLKYYSEVASGGSGTKTLASVPVNAWTYFCITESSGTLKCYINNDSTPKFDESVNPRFATSGHIYIGSKELGDYSNALIDDIRVYNGVLSADEVLQNYNAGLSQHKPGSAFSDDFSSDYGL